MIRLSSRNEKLRQDVADWQESLASAETVEEAAMLAASGEKLLHDCNQQIAELNLKLGKPIWEDIE